MIKWVGHSRFVTFPHCRKFHWIVLPFGHSKQICELSQWVKWNVKDILDNSRPLGYYYLRTLSTLRVLARPLVVLSDVWRKIQSATYHIQTIASKHRSVWQLSISIPTHKRNLTRLLVCSNTLDFHPAINSDDNVSSYFCASIFHFEGYLRWRGYFGVVDDWVSWWLGLADTDKEKVKHFGLFLRTLSWVLLRMWQEKNSP